MRLLFVMDPAETMTPDKDTSFAFMRGAQARGHQAFHCLPRELGVEGDQPFARVRPISVSPTPPHAVLGEPARRPITEFDAVFVRKDPPFDVAYLHLTQMLDLARARTLVINDPAGLRAANEKLFALQFQRYMPATLVTADRDQIHAFVEQVGGQAVLKPLDGAGGLGVVALTRGDQNQRALVDLLTREGREHAMVQEFQPAVRTGDKRVLMLDGAPLGAILRVPRSDDLRANIHVGGTVQPTTLTPAERALVADVGGVLQQHGLWFAGLDLIGERLIEVNVTSPTGLQELGRHLGRPVEEDVIAWVEQRAAALRGSP